MALSPADFYAYSRATGASVPEDPEERARIAPEVLAYRRNQLKAPEELQQQGPDPLSVGLGIGLGLAGLGAAGYGLNRLFRGPKQAANAGVKQVNLADMVAENAPVRRVVQETEPQPSRPAPTAQRVPDPWETATAPRPETPAQKPEGFSPRQYLESKGALPPAEDLTSVQQQSGNALTDQAYEAVESGIGQETQRIDVKLQRHTGSDIPDVDIPQAEDPFEAFGLLPEAQRTLTREEKEAKILSRLGREALELGKTTHSAANPFGPEGRRIPPGPLLYPSQIPSAVGYQTQQATEGQTLAGVSSPTREFLSVFAQGDPRVQNVVRRENVEGFERVKTYGGIKGATLLEGDVYDPLSGELLSQGEQISGTGKTKQVLNPAWTEAYKNYWERRAAELPHTLDDYEARKAAGKLNYQLPPEQQTASNNAQMFEKWDKATSEALQNIYAQTVGDTPQYITETVEPKTSFAGTETQYRGDVGSSGETTGAPVPVLNPKGIVYGAQIQGKPAISVGETSLARAAQDPSYASGKVLKFKGEGGATKLDVMPLSYETEQEVMLPSSDPNQSIKGKAKVTRTALVPLQKAVLVNDPQTGRQKTQLVNFSIDLLAPVGTRTAIDEFGREFAKTVTLQEAVNDLRSYHGKDYASLNQAVDSLLKSTHSAYNVPVMTRQPFDKYDEARNEFIRMLSGTQYEAKELGFLTSVEGQKLPYTGPISPGTKGNRAENVANARLMLSQAGVQLDKISDYLPDVDELGPSPRVQTTSTRDVGIPKPDIMSTGTDLGIRTSTYERISPRMGGAVTSQLRTILKNGAQISTDPPGTPGAKVNYTLGDKTVSYPRSQLIKTLQSENQDAHSIAELTGITLKTEGEIVSGPHQALSSRTPEQPGINPMQRSAKPGYYYNEFGELMQEPTVSTFTGPARFAAGPASDVLSGDYPQGGSRASIKTSPVNLKQLQERNEFALTANLTPGGAVRRGALNLGQGLGIIDAGVGGLTESQTIQRYGMAGSQLQQFGRTLMDQAAQRRGLPSGPTSVRTKATLPLADYQMFAFPDEPVQLSIPGVSQLSPPRQPDEMDQIEAYLRKTQRGRSTPLTSEVRIQPSLF